MTARRIMDISSQKPDCLLGSKFSRSGSLLRDETRCLLNYIVKSGNAAKRGGPRRKIWKASKGVWKPCNPLKSHKTAKDLFGKAWSKTREFWRSLEKAWRAPLFRHRWLLPPAASDRAGLSLRGASSKQPRGSFRTERRSKRSRSSRERRPECLERRMARFIQGDRPEAGAELAMTAFCEVAGVTRSDRGQRPRPERFRALRSSLLGRLSS